MFGVVTATAALAQQSEAGPKPIPDTVPEQIRNTNQFRRFWHNYSIRSNGQNQIPDNPLAPAQLFMNAAPPARTVALPTAPPSALATFTGNRWKSLGPNPITTGQIGNTLQNRPMSGREADIAVDPNNANRWMIAAAQGGVWETINAGNTWVARTDFAASLSMGAVAIAKSNSRIAYAGTGEANNSADSYGGFGLLKTTDGGINWTLVNPTIAKYGSFSDLWIDPTNPNVLLAAVNGGVFGRIAFLPPVAFAPSTGIFRSTNGGVSFTQVITGIGGYDIEVNPANKNQVIASVSNRNTTVTNGIYRSTDNGASFTQLTATPWHAGADGVGRVEIALAPSSPNTLYVSIEDPTAPNGGRLLGLWRTNNIWDAVPTWTSISVTATDNGTGTFGYCGWDRAFAAASNQCWYSHDIAVDPSDPNTLYAGGVPRGKFNGTTWTEISRSTAAEAANGIHVDQHALAFAGSRLVVGNDGGVWSSPDGGVTPFTPHNAGLVTMQYYEGAASSLSGLRLIGGAQDNGTSTTSGGAWTLTFGGDGAGTSISPANAANWVVSSQGLNVARTLDGGANYATANNFDHTSAPFIGKLEGCPSNANVFAVGSRNLAQRTDFYSGAAGAIYTNVNLALTMNSGVSALAYGPTCNHIAVGSKGFGMLATSVGGGGAANWTNLGTVMPRPATDAAFDPADPNNLWITLAAFNEDSPGTPGHVMKITNWPSAARVVQVLNTGLNMPHNAIVIDPTDPNIIYVGTDMGVLRSLNGGTTWAPMGYGSGMPNVAIHDLEFSGSRLFAFSHGRGVFELVGYDLDGDSLVNCDDYNIVRAAFGKRVGDAAYNAVADLNSDGVVDIRDLRMMTSQLTGTCP